MQNKEEIFIFLISFSAVLKYLYIKIILKIQQIEFTLCNLIKCGLCVRCLHTTSKTTNSLVIYLLGCRLDHPYVAYVRISAMFVSPRNLFGALLCISELCSTIARTTHTAYKGGRGRRCIRVKATVTCSTL